MMDFDYVCRRSQPSVAAMVYPMVGGDSKQNFYWGHKEVLVPIYKNMADAMRNHPDADVLVSLILCSGVLMKIFLFLIHETKFIRTTVSSRCALCR
jgi:hypothetical protein